MSWLNRRYGDMVLLFLNSIVTVFATKVLDIYSTNPNSPLFVVLLGFLAISIIVLVSYGVILALCEIRKFFKNTERPVLIGLVSGVFAGLIGGIWYATTCQQETCDMSQVIIYKYIRILSLSAFIGISFSIIFSLIDDYILGRRNNSEDIAIILALALSVAFIGAMAVHNLDGLGSLLNSLFGITVVGSGACQSISDYSEKCNLGPISYESITVIVFIFIFLFIFLRFVSRKASHFLMVVGGLFILVIGLGYLFQGREVAESLNTMREEIMSDPITATLFVLPWALLVCLVYWISGRWALRPPK